MSRSRIDEVIAKGGMTPRQAIWNFLRQTKGNWVSIEDAYNATAQNRRTIGSFLNGLVAAKAMECRVREGMTYKFEYCLLKDFGAHAPRFNRLGQPVIQGMGQENIWQSMRMSDRFTARDIALLSSNDMITVKERTVKDYCKHLLAAGYLRVLRKARGGHSPAIYKLIQNTGPRPPMIQ